MSVICHIQQQESPLEKKADITGLASASVTVKNGPCSYFLFSYFLISPFYASCFYLHYKDSTVINTLILARGGLS